MAFTRFASELAVASAAGAQVSWNNTTRSNP